LYTKPAFSQPEMTPSFYFRANSFENEVGKQELPIKYTY